MNSTDSFAILDCLPIGVCILQSNWTVNYCNSCLEDWTKLDKQQIIGQDIRKNFPQFYLIKYQKKLQKTFEDGKSFKFSYKICPPLFSCKTANNKIRMLEITVTPITSSSGVGYDALLSLEDVTEMAECQWSKARLQDQEMFAQQLFQDNLAVKLLIESNTGEIVDFNESACQFYGYDRMTLKKMKLSDLVVLPDGKPIPLKAISTLTYPGHFLFCHRLSDGSIRHVEVYSSKIKRGEYNFIYSIIHDITERFQAQKSLREITNTLEKIIQSSPLAIVIVDVEGAIKVWNQAAERLFGWTQQEILTQPNLPIAENAKILFEKHRKNIDQEAGFSGLELQQTAKDGSTIDVSWSGAYLYDEDGQILGTLNIIEDITERKQAEKNLRFHAEQERLINFITQQIRRSLNLTEILQTTITEVQTFLQAERVMIYRLKKTEFNINNYPRIQNFSYSPIQRQNEHFLPPISGFLDLIADTSMGDSNLEFYPNEVMTQLTIPILQNETLWGWLIAQKLDHKPLWQSWELQLLKRLENQLAIAIHQAELYQQLQTANQKLQQLADQDGLTKIANRRYFDEYLTREWLRLAREQAFLSLILCDIDYFKLYNDNYGHLGGDDCLIKVAKALTQVATRPADLVARYGGEEFALILPNTNQEGAICVAKKIQFEIKKLQLIHDYSLVAKQITLSLGIASFIPDHDLSPEFLIKQADQMLYQAKQEGRNTYCINSPFSLT